MIELLDNVCDMPVCSAKREPNGSNVRPAGDFSKRLPSIYGAGCATAEDTLRLYLVRLFGNKSYRRMAPAPNLLLTSLSHLYAKDKL
jgi:hypothetical protein